MNIAPLIIKLALEFIKNTHRRLPKLIGCMWAIALEENKILIGCATIGRPQARMLQDKTYRLEVTRVAVMENKKNGCSMLYGASSRAAKSMGARDLFTYTHADESGISLRAAGWIREDNPNGTPRLLGGAVGLPKS